MPHVETPRGQSPCEMVIEPYCCLTIGFASKSHSVPHSGRLAIGTAYPGPQKPNFDAKAISFHPNRFADAIS